MIELNSKIEIAIIAAIGKNGELGKNNDLLWRIRDDTKMFMHQTKGFCVIMGRKTYESLGKALPGRSNVVITSNKNFKAKDAFIVHSINDAIQTALNQKTSRIFIIGGGQIYKDTLALANRLYLSRINEEFSDADTYFPHINYSQWRLLSKTAFQKSERNEYAFEVEYYSRIN